MFLRKNAQNAGVFLCKNMAASLLGASGKLVQTAQRVVLTNITTHTVRASQAPVTTSTNRQEDR